MIFNGIWIFCIKSKIFKFDGYLKYLGKDLERVELTTYQNIDMVKLKMLFVNM